jgi:hypothetical protein
MARRRIGEILIKAGVLDPQGLRAALAEQQRWGGQLGRILVEMKLISEEVLVRALSHQLNLPSVDLTNRTIAPAVLELVPGELAEQLGILPFNVENKFLDVAMSDPTNLGISDELRIRTRYTVRPCLAGPKAIENALATYYNRGPAFVKKQAAMHGRGEFSSPTELDIVGSGASGIPVHDAVPAVEVRAAQQAQVSAALQRAGSGIYKAGPDERNAEIRALQQRISELEALVTRDEDVLRKLLGLLVEKGVASREEILERIK